MKYQIEQWPAFRVAGISHRIKANRAFELVPRIWAKALKDGTMKKFMSFFPDYRPSGFLEIAAGAESGCSDEMDYIQAVTNYVETPRCSHVPAPEGMTEFSYSAATWVVINADGEIPKAINDIYQEFYSEWLPCSGYKLSGLPIFECYMQENHQEVWIAVEKA